jgi:hypothetical protein
MQNYIALIFLFNTIEFKHKRIHKNQVKMILNENEFIDFQD